MRTLFAFILSFVALHAAEYPMASNLVSCPIIQVSNAVEGFAAYTCTNNTTFGDWGCILARNNFTNRFNEAGVQFWYNCCAFGPPSFQIHVTSLSSNRTRLKVCAHPTFAKGDAVRAFNKRNFWAANQIMTNVIANLQKGAIDANPREP